MGCGQDRDHLVLQSAKRIESLREAMRKGRLHMAGANRRPCLTDINEVLFYSPAAACQWLT